MPHIQLRPDLYGITSLLDYRKEAADPLCRLTHVLLRGQSTLTESERELIATYISYLNQCTFCTQAHAAAACMLPGGSNEQIEALYSDIDSMPANDKIKSLLLLAEKVQQSGSNVSAEDITAARIHGATDVEIHDTVLIAALFCLYNRYVDGLATLAPTEPAFYKALAQRITSRGYVMPGDGYHALQVNAEN